MIFVFEAACLARYLKRSAPHLLLWTLGLVFYGMGTLAEVILSFAFNGLVPKRWYLNGAMLTAAWLGQGTIHLLVRKHAVAPVMTGMLFVVSLLAVGLILLAPLTPAAASYNVTQPISSQYKDILTRGGLTILLTILLNIYSTLTLVGGAVYSAIHFWRKRVLFNRMIGNMLISAGALIPATAGWFIKMGLVDGLYLSELVGVVLMYVGFVKATAIQVREKGSCFSGVNFPFVLLPSPTSEVFPAQAGG